MQSARLRAEIWQEVHMKRCGKACVLIDMRSGLMCLDSDLCKSSVSLLSKACKWKPNRIYLLARASGINRQVTMLMTPIHAE